MPHELMPRMGRGAAHGRTGRNSLVALVVGDGQEDWMLPDEAFNVAGCTVVRADGVEDAAGKCAKTAPELVFMPLTLDGKPTSHHLRQCLSVHPAPVVVVIASNEEINAAADAMRVGAYDCLFKPFSQARLTRTIEGAIKQLRQAPPSAMPATRHPAAPTAVSHAAPIDVSARSRPIEINGLRLARRGFVASSPQMKAVLSQAAAVAASEATVFITGEVGTGKSALARIVHDLSRRAAGPFVSLDCATVDADRFENDVDGAHGAFARAAGGTLFLDEIGDLQPELQPMLLRLLDRSPADGPTSGVRVIAATGHDLRAAVRTQRMRADLFYRLHVAPIALPPLRAREGDLALIARTRLAEFSEAEGRGFVGFSDAAMGKLAGYPWPGNLRELINIIWTIVLMNEGPLVTPELLPPEIRNVTHIGSPRHRVPPAPAERVAPGQDGLARLVGRTLADIEKTVIEETIRAEGGSVPRAARVLDVSPSTLYRKRDAWAKQDKS